MTEDKLLNQAELCGFDHACIIETDQLIFDSRFRQFCETNYCGNYDNNQCLLIKQLSVTSNSYICSGHTRIGTDAKEHKVFASES